VKNRTEASSSEGKQNSIVTDDKYKFYAIAFTGGILVYVLKLLMSKLPFLIFFNNFFSTFIIVTLRLTSTQKTSGEHILIK
jgi:hypothetical protein